MDFVVRKDKNSQPKCGGGRNQRQLLNLEN